MSIFFKKKGSNNFLKLAANIVLLYTVHLGVFQSWYETYLCGRKYASESSRLGLRGVILISRSLHA